MNKQLDKSDITPGTEQGASVENPGLSQGVEGVKGDRVPGPGRRRDLKRGSQTRLFTI